MYSFLVVLCGKLLGCGVGWLVFSLCFGGYSMLVSVVFGGVVFRFRNSVLIYCGVALTWRGLGFEDLI